MDTPERLLLIVEDDDAFARTLSRSFERRGYRVLHATGPDALPALLAEHSPDHAVVDLKLAGNGSGLTCVQALHAHDPSMVIVWSLNPMRLIVSVCLVPFSIVTGSLPACRRAPFSQK